jgi:hypothetical protein
MDDKELQPNSEDTVEEQAPQAEPFDDDSLMGDELAGFSIVADETIQAVDELYGGIPPIEGEYGEETDSALAVASVSDAAAQREAEREFVLPAFEPALPMPPMSRLRRGRLGSLVPALVLIALGAWLTLTTTAGTPPDPALVAGAAVGGLVLTLLAQWIATGRWGRGYLFFALLIVLLAGILVFSTQPGGLSLVRGWPLLVIAVGLAVILSGLLSRPVYRRLLQPGLLLVIAGLLGMIVTNNVLPQRLLTTAALWAPVVAVVVAVLWLLPLVFRRRG